MNLLRPVLKVALFTLFIISSFIAAGQGVGIGTDTPHPSAILDLASDSSGVLIPRMTGAQRDAIDTLAEGLLVYVTDDSSFYFYTGATWSKLGNADGILSDFDGDTKVMVELTPDDDIIRFETAGEEHFRMIGNRLEPVNSGKSVYIGKDAGGSNQLDIAGNVFIGDSTGVQDTSSANTAVGVYAMRNNTQGAANSAFGAAALENNVTGTGNVSVGYQAMLSHVEGFYNTAMGFLALSAQTSSSFNTAVGSNALASITDGENNTAVGHSSMAGAMSGENNVAIGSLAGYFNSGDNNVLIGPYAGTYNQASNRLFIENTIGDSSQALIYGEFDSDLLRINGTLNINGAYEMPSSDGAAGQFLTTDGLGNASWVDQAPVIADADNDTKIQVEESVDEDILRIDLDNTEYFVLEKGRINVKNTGLSVFLGDGAGANDDLTGNMNVAVGLQALFSNTSGALNVALGADALQNNTTGNNSVAVGSGALKDNTTGFYNTAVGQSALRENTTGSGNTALGLSSLTRNTTGTINVAVGSFALQDNTTGNGNVAVGEAALLQNLTGNDNIAIGPRALLLNTNGSQNVAVGHEAGRSALGDSSVFIGVSAGRNESASHRLYIENSPADATNALIYGEFDNDLLRVNGTLNINSAYDFPQADGANGQVLTTDGAGTASWSDLAPAVVVTDADNDTKIQVEESADEDIIRFDIGGTERFIMNGGRLDMRNTGESVFIGENAGAVDDLTSNKNVYIGFESGMVNVIGGQNVAVGWRAMKDNTTGFNNVAVGLDAFANNTTGHNNVAVGIGSLVMSTTGIFNTALGTQALLNSNGNNNLAVGYRALFLNTGGSSNVAVGSQAGYSTTGNGGVFLGNAAGINETQGNRLYIENSGANAANALIYGEFDTDYLRVNGHLSTRNGFSDADKDTKIQVEEGIDDDVIRFDIAGTENFVMHDGRLEFLNSGNSVFIGEGAGQLDDQISNSNVGIGQDALGDNVTGASNVAIGADALGANTSGNGNVAIGRSAGASATGTFNIFIGQKAGQFETLSNKLYIEPTGADSDNALIYGDFATDALKLNGSVAVKNRSANGTAFEVLNSASSALLIIKEAGSISMPTMPTGSGSAVQISGGQLVSNTSTRRDKRNIQTFDDEFEKILQVLPRKYERPHTPGKTEIGYIAEEMDSIGLGALVLRSDEGVIEGLTYDKIVMYTNEVVKQHESRIDALEALVEKQAAQIQLQHDNIDKQMVLIEKQAALIDHLLGQEKGVQENRQADSSSFND